MPSTRETAQKYIDFIAALKFAEAFKMLASDAKYRIIGKTPPNAKGRRRVVYPKP